MDNLVEHWHFYGTKVLQQRVKEPSGSIASTSGRVHRHIDLEAASNYRKNLDGTQVEEL